MWSRCSDFMVLVLASAIDAHSVLAGARTGLLHRLAPKRCQGAEQYLILVEH